MSELIVDEVNLRQVPDLAAAERAIHDSPTFARHDIAQAPSRRPAHLVDGQVRGLDDGSGCIVPSPGFHSTLEAGGSVAQESKTLHHKLRGVPLGAHGQDRNVLWELTRKILLDASDYGVHHLVLTARLEHFEVGQVHGGQGAAALKRKPLKFVAVAHVEDKELLPTIEAFKEIRGGPDGFVRSLRHEETVFRRRAGD
jgi:hypothetical protein